MISRLPASVLQVMIILFIVFAGCTGMAKNESSLPARSSPVTPIPESPAMSIPTTSPASPPAHIICPQRQNEPYWISTDPVRDTRQGDRIEIHGETNLPEGQVIDIGIFEAMFHPHCKCCFDDQIRTIAKVRGNRGCNNTFAVTLDTPHLMPQEYFLTATLRDDPTIVSTYRLFTIGENTTPGAIAASGSGVPVPRNAPLSIDPADSVNAGDVLSITARTNQSKAIRYSLRNNRYPQSIHHTEAGTVMQGIMYPSPYGTQPLPSLFRINTSELDPGDYIFSMEILCSGETSERAVTIFP